MPSSDAVTLIVSTGLGIGVIAGIVSGVCYVLAHGFNSKRGRKAKTHWYCAICGIHFRSIQGVLDTDKVATCQKCERRICKKRCSKRDHTKGGWMCQHCVKSPSWFQEIISTFQLRYKKYLRDSKNKMSGRIDEIDEDIEEIRKKEKEQVRDFVERLVASLLGGNVDDISITRMYKDEQYDFMFERYHQDLSNALTDLGSALHISIANLPVVGQSPCTAHTNLKQLIEKLLRDADILPKLNGRVEDIPAPTDERSRMYEDLLATAILNKVVNNSQNNLPSSSAASVSSRFSTGSKNRYKNEYFLGEETLEEKWRNNDVDETTSVSSLEEWLHSDSSLGSTKFVDRMSLTIQQHIEGEAVIESEDEPEDDPEHLRPDSSFSNENANWYLQKRSFHNSHSPIPVPMLVPNPTNEAKVLIGDKDIEETSDLSDVASDYEETEPVLGVNSLLVQSKMIIGGKNPLSSLDTSLDTNNMSDDEHSSTDSGVKEDRSEAAEEEKYFKVTALHTVGVDDNNLSFNSTNSKTEKDAEYIEKYVALPVRTTMSSSGSEDENEIPNDNLHKETLPPKIDDEISEFQGSYSKKEKEKWKKPVEMKNNPYSKENIERRIKTSKTFGRDYYARQASAPSGGKKAEQNGEWAKGFNAFRATMEEDTVNENEINGSEITSDSDLSLVNCYDVENSKIYRQSSDGDQKEIVTKVNTEGLLYTPIDVELQPPDHYDEEHQPTVWTRVNSEGLLNTPKDDELQTQDIEDHWSQPQIWTNDDVIQTQPEADQSSQPKTWIKVNTEGLLYTPDVDAIQPQPEEDQRSQPKTWTKVNTEGLLYTPDVEAIQPQPEEDQKSPAKIWTKVNSKELHHNDDEDKSPESNNVELQTHLSSSSTIETFESNHEPIIRKTVNSEGLLYDPDESKDEKEIQSEPIKNTPKTYTKLNSQGLLYNPNYQQNEIIPIEKKHEMHTKVNTEGLLYVPETRELGQIIERDENHNQIQTVPQVKPRSFIAPNKEIPVAQKRSKPFENDLKETEDKVVPNKPKIIHQKSDNTLIKKIYSNPVVRSFALTNREQIPVSDFENTTFKKPSESVQKPEDTMRSSVVSPVLEKPQEHQISEAFNKTLNSSVSVDDFITTDDDTENSFSLEYSENGSLSRHNSVLKDPEISELKDKKLVASRLGEFSKSFPNLKKLPLEEDSVQEQRFNSTETLDESTETSVTQEISREHSISVKDLRKMFEKKHVTNERPVHSLTARSISKQMRENLKRQSMHSYESNS